MGVGESIWVTQIMERLSTHRGRDGPVPVRRFDRETWPPMQEAFYQACVAAGLPVSPTDAELVSDAALDRWLQQNVATSYHVSGTCKMGPASDSMAVVEQWCRVHGMENLRVADAAIMPDVVRANTHVMTR